MRKSRWFVFPEYCGAQFYTGWWLYLRQRTDGTANDDGDWGWIRHNLYDVVELLDDMGVNHPAVRRFERTGEYEFINWFAEQYPAGIEVSLDKWPYPRELKAVVYAQDLKTA
jgi:hypothetical protein